METNTLLTVIPEIVRLRTQENLKNNQSKSKHSSTKELSKVIHKIIEAYHLDWEKDKLEFAKNFLARTWAGMPLPVLSICGRGTQEIRYSKYLGYFMDGTKSHGLGYRYLDELLALVTKEKIDTYNATVETEKWIGKAQGPRGLVNCICDNVILCDNYAIFIEQKIGSGESINQKTGTKQLKRYSEAIAKNEEYKGKKQICIYLTPTGKQSMNTNEWKPVSHSDLVNCGMKVLSKGGISNIARDNLRRFLLDLVLGPFKKSEDEIHELVESAKATVLNPSFKERLRFDRLVSQNELLVKILMEG